MPACRVEAHGHSSRASTAAPTGPRTQTFDQAAAVGTPTGRRPPLRHGYGRDRGDRGKESELRLHRKRLAVGLPEQEHPAVDDLQRRSWGDSTERTRPDPSSLDVTSL